MSLLWKNVIFWYFYENFGNFKILQNDFYELVLSPVFTDRKPCILAVYSKKRNSKRANIDRFMCTFWNGIEFNRSSRIAKKHVFSAIFGQNVEPMTNLESSTNFQKMPMNRSIFARFESCFLTYIAKIQGFRSVKTRLKTSS